MITTISFVKFLLLIWRRRPREQHVFEDIGARFYARMAETVPGASVRQLR
ncbi:hypothetical protein ACE1TH_10125 [Shouchella sp. JSM 1781072]